VQSDPIIIGSGQAGNPLWVSPSDRGGTVALIEHVHLGETCNNPGRTSSKTMVTSAQIAEHEQRWWVPPARHQRGSGVSQAGGMTGRAGGGSSSTRSGGGERRDL
jgi:hypothetical protein